MFTFLKLKYHNLQEDKKFSEIFTGSIYALGARVIATCFALGSSVIVARFYGVEAVGILAVIKSFLMFATIFTVLGMDISVLRLIPEFIAKYSVTSAFRIFRKTQGFVAAFSIVTGIGFFFSSQFIAEKVFSKPQLADFIALASAFIVFKSLMELTTHAVRGLRLIRTFAFMQALPSVSMLVILLIMTCVNRDQGNPVYAQLGAFAVVAITGVLIIDRSFKKRMSDNDATKSQSIRQILSLSTPMLMTSSIEFLNGQAGIILLGVMRSEDDVGYFSVAFRLASLTLFLLHAINSMAAPKFSELYHTGKIDELFYIARKSSKLIFWTTIPLLLILTLGGEHILTTLFGKEFTVAYTPLLFMVTGQFVNSISGSTGFFMNMTGGQKILRNIMFASALINILIGVMLIPRLGISGAAIGSMIGQIVLNGCVQLSIKKKYGRTIGYVPFLVRS